MENLSIEAKVLILVKETLEKEDCDIGWSENLFDYGLNSMKSIALIVKLEEEFDVVFEDEELLFENFTNIHLITDRLKEHLNL
ncbi:acyl carrier protein [Paenibacillus polysaccharolyticus]|uniref:acyl carrier protein n=1 Tax=Paenibacillus polysaccharolyticus TaxID=582692 RepID=UPI00203B0D30|nr:acyl carrier protein [Paenibacillus polysaccharolyticus]MCM3135811.1 acyl carrier protein [Paenibacillus polysaccharolyticus]